MLSWQQQRNKERRGAKSGSTIIPTFISRRSQSSRLPNHHHHHHQHHHYDPTAAAAVADPYSSSSSSSSFWKKRYNVIIFLALASAIFLYHTATFHGLATMQASSRQSSTTTSADSQHGPPVRREIFTRRRRLPGRRDFEFNWNTTANKVYCIAPDEYDVWEGFRLARQQSFGFFNDTPNAIWQRAQEIHAKTFPNFHRKPLSNRMFVDDMAKGEPSSSSKIVMNNYADASFDNERAVRESRLWYADHFHVEFHCPLAQRIPSTGQADGPKWVCDPHRIAAQEKCLVYSVGSNGNVLFEQGIRQDIGSHCEIHTFDIRERNDKNVVFAHALHKYNATFHHWGIGTPHEAAVEAVQAAQAGRREPRMKTLYQTILELNHSHQTIDIFKIDCESCEWWQYTTWLDAMRAANVTIRQILVETHHIIQPSSSAAQHDHNQQQQQQQHVDVDDDASRNFFMTLHDAGYVIFSKEVNYEAQGSCVEFAFIQLSSDFFVNNTFYHAQQQQRGYYNRVAASKSSL